jgi:hypothetical protein
MDNVDFIKYRQLIEGEFEFAKLRVTHLKRIDAQIDVTFGVGVVFSTGAEDNHFVDKIERFEKIFEPLGYLFLQLIAHKASIIGLMVSWKILSLIA